MSLSAFKRNLLRRAFEGNWPLYSTPAEVESWFAPSRKDVPPQMRTAYRLGKVYREVGSLTEDQMRELDGCSSDPDFAVRVIEEIKRDQEMQEVWLRALGAAQ